MDKVTKDLPEAEKTLKWRSFPEFSAGEKEQDNLFIALYRNLDLIKVWILIMSLQEGQRQEAFLAGKKENENENKAVLSTSLRVLKTTHPETMSGMPGC